MPGTVAVNTVEVDVLSTIPNGIASVFEAEPPTVAEPAYFSSCTKSDTLLGILGLFNITLKPEEAAQSAYTFSCTVTAPV